MRAKYICEESNTPPQQKLLLLNNTHPSRTKSANCVPQKKKILLSSVGYFRFDTTPPSFSPVLLVRLFSASPARPPAALGNLRIYKIYCVIYYVGLQNNAGDGQKGAAAAHHEPAHNQEGPHERGSVGHRVCHKGPSPPSSQVLNRFCLLFCSHCWYVCMSYIDNLYS